MTVQEILSAAITPNADAFRAALITQAEMHDDYAVLSRNAQATRGAEAMRNACLSIYDDAARGDIEAMTATTGKLVVSLNAACKLLDIPAHQRTAALVAFEESN